MWYTVRYPIFICFVFTQEDTAPDTLGSTRTYNWWPGIECLFLTSNPNAVALSPLTYAENVAHYPKGEVAWRSVRKLVETTAYLIDKGLLRTHRSKVTLEAKITCVLHLFIRAVRYASAFHSVGFSLQRRESSSPVPSKELVCQVGSPIPAANVVLFPGGYSILCSAASEDGKLFQ